MRAGQAEAEASFPRCAAADTVDDACAGLAEDLVAVGFELPSIYLLSGRRLRCVAARGYFQVVDGFTSDQGVVGSVVAGGRSMLVQDVTAHAGFLGATPGLVAEACSPVRSTDRVIGAVSVESRSPLPPGTLDVLDAAARALSRRIDELGGLPRLTPVQVLAQTALPGSETIDAETIGRRAVEAAVDMSRLRSAAVVCAAPDGPVVTASTGPLSEQMASWTRNELVVLTAAVGPHTSSHFPGGGEVRPEHGFLDAAGVRALSVHPLVHAGRTEGWLVLADTLPVAQQREDVELLEVLAAQTAAASRLARMVPHADAFEVDRDRLTGMRTRAHLTQTLRDRFDTHGGGARRIGLLMLDLDDFRHVNDALGHDAGDQVLRDVAAGIQGGLREQDRAFRMGGDEFAVVLPDVSHGTAVAIAERMLAAVRAVRVGGADDLTMTASVGVVVLGSYEAPDQLQRGGDLAMYLAKERGKDRYALFEPQMQDASTRRLSLLSDLRKALREEEFRLVYQPIVDLGSGRMTGLEALLRWDRPGHGAVSPVDFVPLAESTGLIVQLGDWVLRQSCAQLALWDAQGGDPALRVSVNLSNRQLESCSLLATLDECLRNGLNPSRLILEITETALSLDTAVAREILQAIRNRGVHLAVDDFGTGYSSLGLLTAAPVSRLKIDRQFVSGIGDSGADVPVVDAIIAMARGLGLAVVAEGVETAGQLDYLRRAGCGEVQGYLFARPLEVADASAPVQGARPWDELLEAAAPAHGDALPDVAALVDLAVGPAVGLEALVRPLLEELRAVTGLEMTYLTTVDAARTRQRVELAHGPAGSPVSEGLSVAWQETLCSRALTVGPSRTADAQAAFPDAAVARELGLRAYVVEPVYSPSGQLYGTLCGVSRTSMQPTESDSATMRLFARLVTEKLRQTSAPAATPAAGATTAGATAAAGVDAVAARRAAGRRAWDQARQARERAARAELAVRPDAFEARKQLQQLAATQAAVLEHDEQPQQAPPDGPTRRVLVADDDPVIRQIVEALVEAHPRLHLAAAVGTAAEAVGASIVLQPDLVVLDFDLGDGTAQEVIPEVREFAPGTQILLHSARPDVFHVGQQFGVDRSVFKGDSLDRLVAALDAMAG